jgi:hypothetical protein
MLVDDTEEDTVNLEDEEGSCSQSIDSVHARGNVWTRPVLHSSVSIHRQRLLG